MDERVIDVPKWLRTFLVKGIILNTRPRRSAEAYKKIWWDEGSPLIVLSERLQAKVQDKTSVPIALAMRYGKPSIATGLAALQDQGVDDVLLVPLYPQQAMATTETIIVLAEQIRAKDYPDMVFTHLPAFYKHPDYIRVLSQSIQEFLQEKIGSTFCSPIMGFLKDICAKPTSPNRIASPMSLVVKPLLWRMSTATDTSVMRLLVWLPSIWS